MSGSREAVQAIYDAVPPVTCKGLCWESCGLVPMTKAEADYLGSDLTFDADMTCSQLNPLHRCGVYARRPLLCRLWGATPEMRCQFGCEPTLTADEARNLLQHMLAVGGPIQFPKPESK